MEKRKVEGVVRYYICYGAEVCRNFSGLNVPRQCLLILLTKVKKLKSIGKWSILWLGSSSSNAS
jgi:hypothetical protein